MYKTNMCKLMHYKVSAKTEKIAIITVNLQNSFQNIVILCKRTYNRNVKIMQFNETTKEGRLYEEIT